jgi:glycosyltransferase involved in cell wall biosynthesis
VVTPTYNRAQYLEECLRSVLDQDYPNLEYIVVDGASSNPEVLRIIRKYEQRLAWWISEKDGGHAEAIRKGFDRATGEVLAWLCSDDVYLPGALHTVGQCFARNPKADVVYGNALIIGPQGERLREVCAVPYTRLALIHHVNILQPASFWTRALYERVGGQLGGPNLEYNVYEPNIELFCRFANARATFIFVRQVLAAARDHDARVKPDENFSRLVQGAWRNGFPIMTKPGIFEAVKVAMRMRQLFYYLIQGDFEELKRYFATRWRTWTPRF